MKSAAFALGCSALLALPSLAHADEPLNGTGPEPCTLEAFQKESRECVVCRAYYRNRDHCERALTEYNFSKSCRTRDASTWREVWCRKPDGASKKLPTELVASLDDATAGEKDRRLSRDAGVADEDAGTLPSGTGTVGDAGPAGDGSGPLVVRKPEGGCACSANGVGVRGISPWLLVFATTAAGLRRATRCKKGRLAR